MARVDEDSGQATTATGLTITAFTPSGSNRLLVTAFGWSAATPSVITSLEFGGVTIGDVAYASGEYSDYYRNESRTLKAPAASSGDIVLDLTDTHDEIGGGVAAYADVDQTTPVENANTATGDADDPTVVISSATGDIVFGAIYDTASGSSAVKAGTNSVWAELDIGNFNDQLGVDKAGAASVTLEIDSGGTVTYHFGGFSIKAAAAGATVFPQASWWQ